MSHIKNCSANVVAITSKAWFSKAGPVTDAEVDPSLPGIMEPSITVMIDDNRTSVLFAASQKRRVGEMLMNPKRSPAAEIYCLVSMQAVALRYGALIASSKISIGIV